MSRLIPRGLFRQINFKGGGVSWGGGGGGGGLIKGGGIIKVGYTNALRQCL